jgi:head-tail adaptor
MSSFNYYDGIREDAASMIEEVGTSCTIESPTIVYDAFGNHVSTSFSSVTETIWIRAINQRMDIEGIGQLNVEDIRIIAGYNTTIVPESRITYNGKKYYVLGQDSPDESGNITHKVFYGKRELT